MDNEQNPPPTGEELERLMDRAEIEFQREEIYAFKGSRDRWRFVAICLLLFILARELGGWILRFF